MGCQQFPFRQFIFMADIPDVIHNPDDIIEFAQLTDCFQVFVHLLVGYDRQCKVTRKMERFVFIKDCARV